MAWYWGTGTICTFIHDNICKIYMIICDTLKDSSKFSPPQMSNPLSYVPSFSKNDLSILNNPPAIVGLHTGSAEFLCFLRSRSGTACQLNCITWYRKNYCTININHLNTAWKNKVIQVIFIKLRKPGATSKQKVKNIHMKATLP